MNNQNKYEYAKQHWELRDGIVYSKRTGKPVSFSCKTGNGRRLQLIEINGKRHAVLVHEAVFALFHNRPIAEDKEIHHKDGNPENNAPENLIELTRKQHKRIHQFQCDDPMRGIYLYKGAWRFQWVENNGRLRNRCFHGINEAMAFRDEIEEPRRQELRTLGLNCRRVVSGEKSAAIRPSKIYFSRSNAIL
ncbi:HNH endonuclease [Escherichia coli]|uniref:HNH endonuclease signature motif containing protein n=1 Tax=Escherichia coli TaxID=562 RepID=UPI001F0FD89B|nr:HNH endonuclease signature motif containing protein [Escherichia coli]MCH4755785.1 HNH endonuclease [Escherichia coli]